MQEILFLIPFRLTRPYFNLLYNECEYSIFSRFGEDLRPISRGVPREPEEFEPQEVMHILRRELRMSRNVRLLVVAPTASEEFTRGIAEVAHERGLPVVALSLPFQFPHHFIDRNLPVPPTVHCDSCQGTRELARAACRELHTLRPKLKKPRVVLIPGQANRTDSRERVNSFRAGLIDAGLAPEVIEVNACNWQRPPARRALEGMLDDATPFIDLVFAANDEMALGARDALHSVQADDEIKTAVYGFDAIAEVCDLIEDNDDHMKGTIEQDTTRMAVELADLIARMLTPHVQAVENVLVPPRRIWTTSHTPPSVDELARNLQLSFTNGEWVNTETAAKEAEVEPDTLNQMRTPSRKPELSTDLTLGRDTSHRIWRVAGGGVIYYYRPSLKKK